MLCILLCVPTQLVPVCISAVVWYRNCLCSPHSCLGKPKKTRVDNLECKIWKYIQSMKTEVVWLAVSSPRGYFVCWQTKKLHVFMECLVYMRFNTLHHVDHYTTFAASPPILCTRCADTFSLFLLVLFFHPFECLSCYDFLRFVWHMKGLGLPWMWPSTQVDIVWDLG